MALQFAPKITGDFRLAKDPELRYTAGGTPVANLRVVGQRYVGKETKDGKEVAKYQPIFMTMVAWRKRAESYAANLKKGDLVSIEAQLNTRSWKKEGQEYETTVLEGIVDRLSLRSRPAPKVEGAAATEATGEPETENDIPGSVPEGLEEDIPV